MDFRERVEQEIKDFSIEEKVTFGWRCAVRAVPFLGSKGHFNFWKRKDLQKNLYVVFNALDLSAYYFIDTSRVTIDVLDVAIDIDETLYADATFASLAAYNASCYDVSHAAAVLKNIDIDLKSQVLEDIKVIKATKKPILQIDIYGTVWTNFIKALLDSDCGYWANWYTKLFKNNFEYDLEEVK